MFLDVGTWGHLDPDSLQPWIRKLKLRKVGCFSNDYDLEIGLSWIVKLWAFHSTYSQTFLFFLLNKFFIF